MPSKTRRQFTDAFVRDLTWATALRDFWKDHERRNEQRRLKGLPEKQIKAPTQVAYYCTPNTGYAVALIIGYGGHKAFRGTFYEAGKPVSMQIGAFPETSVDEACAAAESFYLTRKPKTKDDSFEQITERYIKHHVDRKKLISKGEIVRSLNKYLLPEWKNRAFAGIRRGDINGLLDKIAENNGPVMADACLAILRSICNWYRIQVEDYASPLVPGMSRSDSNPRDRILNNNEIKVLWEVAEKHGTWGRLLKFALLTGQRRAKIADMRWDDIENGTWVIRKEPREKNVPYSLRLPALAREILKMQPRIATNPHVFGISAKKPFNSWAPAKTRLIPICKL